MYNALYFCCIVSLEQLKLPYMILAGLRELILFLFGLNKPILLLLLKLNSTRKRSLFKITHTIKWI